MNTVISPSDISGSINQGIKITCTFREISESVELEQAFRFRYLEYSQCRLSIFLKKNVDQLDLDDFDLHSKHFGVFTEDGLMVGYLRVVLEKDQFYNPAVFEVGKHYGLYTDAWHSFGSLQQREIADFPFLSYPFVPEGIHSFYQSLKARNVGLAEASRLIIARNFRGLRSCALLIECAMMLFMIICYNRRHAVISVCEDHVKFYEKYGFRPLQERRTYNLFRMSKETVCLSLSSVPSNLPARIKEMTEVFLKTGKVERTLRQEKKG
jgi:predicted GNAT family N-acyltransferase